MKSNYQINEREYEKKKYKEKVNQFNSSAILHIFSQLTFNEMKFTFIRV